MQGSVNIPGVSYPDFEKLRQAAVLHTAQTLNEAQQAQARQNIGAMKFKTDKTLTLKDGVLSVNTADAAEADNTLPITSAAVHTQIGNIEVILQTI